MLKPVLDFASAEPVSLPMPAIEESIATEALVPASSQNKLSKQAIRTSLKASTLDSIFSSIFGCVTGGVLLTNFLLQIGATNVEIGLLSALPMVINFLQPVGAYIADKQTSRKFYNLIIFGISRLLWLLLVAGIAIASWFHTNPHHLVFFSVAIVFAANLLSSLGCASWLSWMMVIVPHRLRGRYFGFRNSAASLTSLLCMPLLGLALSYFGGTDLNGYAIVLFVGVLAGILSLVCQSFKADVNPQIQATISEDNHRNDSQLQNFISVFKDGNFLIFLFYFGFWTFAVNISSPFFNIYLLKNLAVNIGSVTVYNSLSAAANLVALLFWGKLADRVGNRVLLMFVGILVAVTPLFWLGTGNSSLSLWLFLPLIHILTGSTWAAIDLCSNNIQMELASKFVPSTYFAVAAAVAGLSGALGTTVGGFLAEFPFTGGLSGLFAFSAVLRLFALLPLVVVKEPRGSSLSHLFDFLGRSKSESSVL